MDPKWGLQEALAAEEDLLKLRPLKDPLKL